MIRRLPDENDPISQPAEWVVIANNPQKGIISLSMPTFLNEWLLKWYSVRILVETFQKNYSEFETGNWEYRL